MRHQHWIGRFLADEWKSLLIYTVVLALLVQISEYAGWFASFEGRVQDLLLRTTAKKIAASNNKVVTVEIDDYAYKTCFGAKSPLDPKGVTDLVAGVEQVGPAVIGVDILTSSGIEKYAETYRSRWSNRPTGPNVVWVADVNEPLSERRRFKTWLWGSNALPEADPAGVLGFDMVQVEEKKIPWGLPLYPLEEDLGVRSLPRRFAKKMKSPEIGKTQEPLPGFAYQVAKTYCDLHGGECHMDSEHNEVLVSYAGGARGAFTLRQIFRCDGNEGEVKIGGQGLLFDRFQGQAKDAIILIGGTFGAARDTYFTPAGRIPGLSLNAYAVQSELAGRSVRDTWRGGIFLVDILLGWLIVFFFWYPAIKLPMSRKVLHRLRRILVGLTWLPIALLVRWPRMKSRMEIRLDKLKTFALVWHNEIRWMIAASLSLVIFTFLASLIVFYFGYLWLTWIGVLIGMGPHVILEIWKMNPRVLKEGEQSSHGRTGPA